MGIVPCVIGCSSNKELQTQSIDLHSESTSVSSQPSLQSIPSLTSYTQQPSIHHQCIATLKGHSSYVFALAVTEKSLYSGSSDREIRVWDSHPSVSQPEHSNSCNALASGKGAVKSLVISGEKLFSAHQDHKIRVWQLNNRENHHYKHVATLPTLRDRLLRFLPPKNHVRVRRHKKTTWVHHVDTISALALSKDSSLLYSASWDRSLKIWRTSDFVCVESVTNAHDDAINAISTSDDGFIYTGSADTKIKVWKKFSTEKKHLLVSTLERHKSAVNALALSSDGSVMYSGTCDRSIAVWERESDVGSGAHMVVVGALRGHVKAILCLSVVSDLVCSGSADKTVRVWRRGIDNGYSCLAVLEGHRGPVKCLATAVDQCSSSTFGSSYIVYSGSLDRDVKVWQLSVPSLEPLT